MYLQHFGLARKPFEQVPDPEFLFLSEKHEAALANIGFAFGIQDSFVIITGEIGSGKTTLLHKFLNENLADAAVAYVTQTRLSDIELLQSILVEFGMDPFGKGKVELITMLKRHIESQHRDGTRVVIVIDEAQNLTAGVLEELRLVTCVSPGTTSLVNVVLAGQPQFNAIIDSPDLVQLKQRCRLRYHLKALTEEETRLYIEHRLTVAGRSFAEIFGPGLVEEIFRHCRGIPRLINMLCDTALIFACIDEHKMVSTEDIGQALIELGWPESPDRSPSPHEHYQPNSLFRNEEGRVVLIDADNGTEYPITEAVCLVGRAQDCSVYINHPALSRYHAMIRQKGEQWIVSDMKSLNGVFLNGRRIRASRLRHNDDLIVGEHRLVFRVASAVGGPDGRITTRPAGNAIASGPVDDDDVKDDVATDITRFSS